MPESWNWVEVPLNTPNAILQSGVKYAIAFHYTLFLRSIIPQILGERHLHVLHFQHEFCDVRLYLMYVFSNAGREIPPR
ncbi:hypothetical protein ACFLUS_04535, partial [Chloroflexota bacterium]